MSRQLAVVIPILNEEANIRPLVDSIARALEGLDWEIVFVDDDSTDGATETIAEVARADPRIRLIHRVGRRGLASACVEGMLATTAPAIAVMDGDLQHDESILPQMLHRLEEEKLDLVIASRNLRADGMGEFPADRVRLSRAGQVLAALVTPKTMTDPMSGFFVLSRSYLLEVVRNLSQIGFKILLDLVASSRRPVRLAEVPYRFRARVAGESKLDSAVETDFLLLIADKLTHRFIPVRYALYGAVGLVGVGVHLLVLASLYRRMPLRTAQITATFAAILCNFCLNNAVTYSDRKLSGVRNLMVGLLVYTAGCSVGALTNVGLTGLLARSGVPALAAGSAGMFVSSVWNYVVATVFTWNIHRRRMEARRLPASP